ncbi:MAG: polysaccharide deacetylase family protein [Chthoniobacterales bacterium]|nr:polysaccharide deacetylase family protein [Chthoniobacterales bacterium]
MFRRSFFSFLPAVLLILSTAFASAQQGSLSTSPSTSPAPVSTNPIAAPTTSSAVPPAMAMQTPQELPSQTGECTSYNSIRVDGPYIAMTFDDGPSAVLTPRLLDILKQRHIHATFFVLGQLVQEHPEIMARAIAEGHEVANHSWDHKALNKLGEGGLQHELADTSATITKTTGKPVTLMRPPYGATNPRLNKAIEKEYGMKVILWAVDPFDWKRPGPQVITQRILAGTQPGSIILAHDIHPGTIEAMPATFDALLAKGFKFVTISELLALESKNPAPAPSASPAPPAQKSSKSKKKTA